MIRLPRPSLRRALRIARVTGLSAALVATVAAGALAAPQAGVRRQPAS